MGKTCLMETIGNCVEFETPELATIYIVGYSDKPPITSAKLLISDSTNPCWTENAFGADVGYIDGVCEQFELWHYHKNASKTEEVTAPLALPVNQGSQYILMFADNNYVFHTACKGQFPLFNHPKRHLVHLQLSDKDILSFFNSVFPSLQTKADYFSVSPKNNPFDYQIQEFPSGLCDIIPQKGFARFYVSTKFGKELMEKGL